MKQPIISLEEFRSTEKRESRKDFCKRNRIPVSQIEANEVFSYLGKFYIEILPETEGKGRDLYELNLMNDTWSSFGLKSLTRRLYEWIKAEDHDSLKRPTKCEKEFPNGFASWQETHFEVVQAIAEAVNGDTDEYEPEFKNVATERRESQGIGGLYELAEELTDKFEKMNEGRAWDGEFFDEITEFIRKELNKFASEKMGAAAKSQKEFFYSDKSGKGITNHMDLEQVLGMEDEQDWNDKPLHGWAKEAEEGEEWEHEATKIVCTKS